MNLPVLCLPRCNCCPYYRNTGKYGSDFRDEHSPDSRRLAHTQLQKHQTAALNLPSSALLSVKQPLNHQSFTNLFVIRYACYHVSSGLTDTLPQAGLQRRHTAWWCIVAKHILWQVQVMLTTLAIPQWHRLAFTNFQTSNEGSVLCSTACTKSATGTHMA